MRIAIVTTHFQHRKGGGIGHVVDNFYNIFNKEHKLYVINDKHSSPNENIYASIFSHGRIKFSIKNLIYSLHLIYRVFFKSKASFFKRICPLIYFFKHPREFFRLVDSLKSSMLIFKRNRFDLIISPSIGFSTQFSFFISTLFKIKSVALGHGDDFLGKMKRFNQYFNEVFLSNFDRIILTNDNMKKLFQKIYPTINSKKMCVINLGIDLKEYEIIEDKEELREIFGISTKKFVLTSIGRLQLRKNFQNVIKAIYLIKKEREISDFLYLIIGEGPTKNLLTKLIDKYQLKNTVFLMGELQDKEIKNKYLKLSDVFIMPSFYDKKNKSIEGFGIVFLESGYYNIPAIGSFSGGIPKAIESGETGFLTKSYDTDELKKYILKLYEDEKIRNRLGANAYKKVIEKHNWEKIYLQFLKIFEGLIEK